MIDLLPALVLLLPRSYALKPYIKASLQPFGVRKIIYVESVTVCRELIVPTHTGITGNYNETVIGNLRSFYRRFYASAATTRVNRRIYVSRELAPRRKIANERAVIDTLTAYNFEVVHFENCSFEKQVAIASSAQYLISNHGAGLTNMLFMKPGGHILELRKAGDRNNNCYFALASSLDLKYFYQLCEPVSSGEDAFSADLIVDIGALRQTVIEMLSADTTPGEYD